MTSGAMPSTPTIALNQLTNTTFITNYIEGEAAKSLLRVKAAGHLTRENPAARKGDITPHTYTINQYINKINLPKSDLDITSKKLYLNKSFTISIKDRTDAINFIDRINTDDITIYTDGSGLNDKLGYGYHISTNKNKTKIAESCGRLPDFCTVFQAEVTAISAACSKLKELDVANKNIYILSDSSSAINALNKCVINSVTLIECLSKISELASNNSFSLSWVPGHCNVLGNEMSDALARRGIEGNTFIKAYIPNSFIKKAINNKIYADSLHTWNSKQSKHMKQTINHYTNMIKEIQKLNKNRKKYRLAIHLMTGHIALNLHLNKIGIVDSNLCPMCNLETENVDHCLAKCPIFYNQRQKYFDTHFATLTEIIKNNTIKNILKYVIETKRLEIPGV